jgi:outer membrane beta-barrel protein
LVTAFALLLIPAAAAAQTEKAEKQSEKKTDKQGDTGFGLDLTAPDEKKAEGEQQSAESTPPPPVADNPPKAQASKDELLEGERDVTVEDRVKSVQRKLYLKKHRFEIAGFFSTAINDPYFRKYGMTLRPAWYLADTLAISLRLSGMRLDRTDDVPLAKRTFQSQLFYSVPLWGAVAGIEWSPIYGKVSIWNDILHFDSYLVGGVGAVLTETSWDPVNLACGKACPRGPNPAADVGIGMRFVARDYLAVNVAVINTSYVDIPTGTTKAAMQNMLTLNAGVSIFYPFKSTAREAE